MQKALARAVVRGVKILLTNADHKCIRELYDGIGNYRTIERKSVIAANARNRRPTTEAIYIIS